MILITGATGHFGKNAIDSLLAKGIPAQSISALVRDETKAVDLTTKGISLRKGDYDDYASLVAAFKGVVKLLFVSGSDAFKRVQQHRNVVNAAKEAGIKHIVYTSYERKNETVSSPIQIIAESHLDTEKNLKASGIGYTIMRNNVYADWIPVFIGQHVLETGILFPSGEGKINFVLRSEMAEVAANILTGSGHENKEYGISNTEAVSFRDIASILSDITGKTVTYTSPSSPEYIEAATKAGLPADYAGFFAAFAEAFKQGEMETAKTDFEQLLGRKPTSVKEYLAGVYAGAAEPAV